jgi:hypothetical protein
MAIPIAYWTARLHALALVLTFSRWEGEDDATPMVSGSGTKTMMHGRVIPDARELSLIQDGHEDRRPLDSHFGAWIVCTDDTTPFEVEARDADGNAIARLSNWTAYR